MTTTASSSTVLPYLTGPDPARPPLPRAFFWFLFAQSLALAMEAVVWKWSARFAEIPRFYAFSAAPWAFYLRDVALFIHNTFITPLLGIAISIVALRGLLRGRLALTLLPFFVWSWIAAILGEALLKLAFSIAATQGIQHGSASLSHLGVPGLIARALTDLIRQCCVPFLVICFLNAFSGRHPQFSDRVLYRMVVFAITFCGAWTLVSVATDAPTYVAFALLIKSHLSLNPADIDMLITRCCFVLQNLLFILFTFAGPLALLRPTMGRPILRLLAWCFIIVCAIDSLGGMASIITNYFGLMTPPRYGNTGNLLPTFQWLTNYARHFLSYSALFVCLLTTLTRTISAK